ncbi:MAG: TonB-dependent receptor [Bacteroidaceae bacterium]
MHARFIRFFVGIVTLLLPSIAYSYTFLTTDAISINRSEEEGLPEEIITDSVCLKEVVVQSFKENKQLNCLPIAASSYGIKTIKQYKIESIKEFSALVPNLFAPDYGSKLTSPVYIRGIGSKINAPAVGLYIDGVPYFEKAAFDFDFNEIASVEVLRGPQGTLYGRNTMGGIINVTTKSPLHYQGNAVSLSLGNYGQQAAHLSSYKKLTNDFAIGISADYHRLGGYFTNETTQEKADAQKGAAAKIKLEWQINPQWSMQLSNFFDYNDQDGYPYATYDAEKEEIAPITYNYPSGYRRLMNTTGWSIDYKGEKVAFHNQVSAQFIRDKQWIDQDFSEADKYLVTQQSKQRMLSNEFTLKSTTPTNYQWLVGSFLFWQQVDKDVHLHMLDKNMSTPKNYKTPAYGFAVYHQSTWNNLLIEGLSFTAGVRYDFERNEQDYKAFVQTANGIQNSSDWGKSNNFSQFTPKVSLHYNFSKQNLLYASVTRGFKTGGFNTSFDTEEESHFDPEYSWNYEVGAKISALENKLKASLALFYIDWKDQQIYQLTSSGVGSMIRNAGESVSKGVEMSLSYQPCKQLDIAVDYGYTKATFKSYDKSDKLSYTGKYLPMVPEQTLSVRAIYSVAIPRWGIDRLTISSGYTGIGRVYWNEKNAVKRPFYGTLDAQICASRGGFSLSLWGKNLTKTDYTAYYFEAFNKGFAQKGKPLTVGTTLAFSF